MKTCCLCGMPSDDGVETCPNDGEASWSTAGADVVAPEPEVETAPEPDGEAPKKRGRR